MGNNKSKHFESLPFISWRWVLLFIVVPFLSSCSKEYPPLKIASSPWPGYEPLYLARDLDYLPKEKANIFEFPSSDITLESFRNRSSDMATLTLDEVIELLSSGVKLRILLALDVSNGADAVIANPKIRSVSDLKGKRIAITNIPLGVYMLSRTLDQAKLTRDDVFVIPAAESKHLKMYQQNKADAFITFEPFKSEIAKAGGHVIFDSSQIPNEIMDLMVVHEDVYQARRDAVCDVAQQWFRTLDFIQEAPDEAASRMGKRLGISGKEFLKMREGIDTPLLPTTLKLLSGKQPQIIPVAANLMKVMQYEGQLKYAVDIKPALMRDFESCIKR